MRWSPLRCACIVLPSGVFSVSSGPPFGTSAGLSGPFSGRRRGVQGGTLEGVQSATLGGASWVPSEELPGPQKRRSGANFVARGAFRASSGRCQRP